MSAIKLYDELIASGIVGANGTTYFELHGIKTQVQDNSVIGNKMKTMKRIKRRMDLARAARVRNKADAERYI